MYARGGSSPPLRTLYGPLPSYLGAGLFLCRRRFLGASRRLPSLRGASRRLPTLTAASCAQEHNMRTPCGPSRPAVGSLALAGWRGRGCGFAEHSAPSTIVAGRRLAGDKATAPTSTARRRLPPGPRAVGVRRLGARTSRHRWLSSACNLGCGPRSPIMGPQADLRASATLRSYTGARKPACVPRKPLEGSAQSHELGQAG